MPVLISLWSPYTSDSLPHVYVLDFYMQYATNFSLTFHKTWIICTTRQTSRYNPPQKYKVTPWFCTGAAEQPAPLYDCFIFPSIFFVQQNLISKNIPYTLALFLFMHLLSCLSCLFFSSLAYCFIRRTFLLQSIIQTFYHRLFSVKFPTKLRRFPYTISTCSERVLLQNKVQGFFFSSKIVHWEINWTWKMKNN